MAATFQQLKERAPTFAESGDFATDHRYGRIFTYIPALMQVDAAFGRVYEDEAGNQYPSVTTVLNALENLDIEKWEAAVGAEEADNVRKRATDRGSVVHKQIERHLLNQPVDYMGGTYSEADAVKKAVHLLGEWRPQIVAIELPLVSESDKTAGTIDFVAWYDGRLTLFDWKTAGKAKNESDVIRYKVQASQYTYMFNEFVVQYKLPLISQAKIVVFPELDQPQIFELDLMDIKVHKAAFDDARAEFRSKYGI